VALGARSFFRTCQSRNMHVDRGMGVPPYVAEHIRGAMADYQKGHMSGADNNIEEPPDGDP